MAPSYANIFKKYSEQAILETSVKETKVWLRFIEDIFMIWPHGKTEFEDFMLIPSNYHQTTTSRDNHLRRNSVQRQKQLCVNQNLQKQTTENVPYLHLSIPGNKKEHLHGLLIRCERICSEERHFEQEAKNIIQNLQERKFPQKGLQEACHNMNKLDRQILLRQTPNKQQQKVKLVTHYNPRNPDFSKVLH